MFGKNNFLAKVICVFMNIDKMVGPNFKPELASLKVMAENKAS